VGRFFILKPTGNHKTGPNTGKERSITEITLKKFEIKKKNGEFLGESMKKCLFFLQKTYFFRKLL